MTDWESLSSDQRQQLLEVARLSIDHGLHHGCAPDINCDKFSAKLIEPGCSFVTLKKDQSLRGCIGSLSAYQPLVSDVSEHAYGAAFKDPRFPALMQSEFDHIRIEVSVLTAEQAIECTNEDDLLAQIEPFNDGLTLRDKHYQATFLPSVWEQLPDKKDFLAHLKAKAGMTADYWSGTLRAYRYGSISFAE